MNDFKNKLRDYKIQPSTKAWDKIESALNKEKKSSASVIYFRWAAAASVAMLITSYAVNYKLPLGAGVAEIQQKDNKTEIKNNAEQYSLENQSIIVTATETEKNESNKEANSYQSSRKNAIILATNSERTENSNTSETFESHQAQIRNNAVLASIPTAISQVNYYRSKEICPDLPEFSTALIEDARIHRKWMNLISEDLIEEGDSTLTERAFDLANKRTITLFQSNIKPMLLDWYRSKVKF